VNNGLRELLRLVLGLQPNPRGDNSDVQIKSLAISPDYKSKTATVDFGTPPACLSLDRPDRDEWSFNIPAIETNAENDEGNDEDLIPRTPTITIDTHFKGITTLRSPSELKIE
jgi:hypothetical protein